MELYQLEYFLEAARQRNFTRAAEHLHLAQAALSEQMRKLEADLGTPLFHRGGRETTLTAAGEVLREHAERLLTQAAEARRAVTDLMRLRGGRVVIGAIPSVSACVLPPVITAFRQEHPPVELALHEGTSGEVAQWVDSGRVDLGIVQLPAEGGAFEETPLFTEAFVLLVPSSHPRSREAEVALASLAGEGFILYKGQARDAALTACREAGFEPRIVCESGELETVRSLAAAGLGVALLPALAVRRLTESCAVLRLIGEPLTRRVALLRRQNQAPSPGTAVLQRLLLEHAAGPSSRS